jgi:hypothetical protein
MNAPKRQHFIPKSYLKNFAEGHDDKYFVEAKLKDEASPKEKLLSIKDICVDKNLYTLPNIDGDDKYAIEKYYAQNIDAVYPKVYDMLIDPYVLYISPDQRKQIIMTTMSLFFRTPKFLNSNNHKNEVILDYAVKHHQDKNGNIKFKFKDNEFDFHVNDLDIIKTKLAVKTKLKFLKEHLEDWHKFVGFKFNAGLSVFRMYEDFNLITSDNPVIMHSISNNPFDVFDPTNMISLPLDNKHYLTIFPNTEPALTDRIFRGDRDKTFGLTTNLDIERNSEDWILGKPKTITNHIADQKKYGAWNKDNLDAVEDMKERATDLQDLWAVIKEVGETYAHQKVADKVRELLKKEIHQKDPEMKKIIAELARCGYAVD